MFEDTIAAIATPLADGAISIIRVSGDQALELVNSIFSRDLSQVQSHSITYGLIQQDGRPVDEVLVSVFKAPKTYTREDVVEINCHGGQFVTRKVLSMLLEKGARLARPGEFTQRAFVNGRIDLSQAEAVQDMIDASNDQAAKMAIHQIKGSIQKLLQPLIDSLMDVIAAIEVNIDYPEYDDVQEMTADILLPKSRELLSQLDDILARSARSQLFKTGIDTVIIGKPNVGKSSLLNALLEEDKAIVTDIAGTTRDIVEGQIHIGPVQLNLIDTAGIRRSEDRIEQIGIEKSRQMLEKARLVLLVLDASAPLDDQDRALLELSKDKERIIIWNKNDLQPVPHDVEGVEISASAGQIERLAQALQKRFDQPLTQDAGVLSNERQIGLLKNARSDMLKAIEAMEAGIEPDLVEIDLMAAHNHLKEILGEVHREDLLDTLFANFCLGK
ncbi:MAG: tRNA uridine-5-carboxymethylaminomethyl(34) synthesis GTPase MnmE [Erysipelotrichaceae bacterium]|nr:tRNA uridine-5-carboxymethylaminomethyl(34) synthesis GTPase MnmE [Erysipelotrichaceae bacterium]